MTQNWTLTTLGQAGTWVSGGTPSTSTPEFWDGDIPWMSSKSLTEFRVRTSDRRLTPLGAQSGTKVVPPDTILMVVRGMSLKTAFRMGISQREVAFGQDLKALIPGPQFDAGFLAYALQSLTPAVLGIVDEAGHGTGRLQTDRLFALEVPVPPLPEQRAIAVTLGALDDKIESNQRALSLIEALVRAEFDKRFRSAHYRSGSAVSDLIEINPQRKLARGAIATYVGMSALPTNGAVVDAWERKEFGSGQRFCNGDVLMARITPCLENGKTAVVDMLADGEVGWGSTEYVVLAPKGDFSTPWIYCLARSEPVRAYAIRSMTGTSGRQRFQADSFEKYRISRPDSASLSAFNLMAIPLFESMSRYRDENRRLAALRDVLIPELLAGRIRVPEAHDAVESVA